MEMVIGKANLCVWSAKDVFKRGISDKSYDNGLFDIQLVFVF